jgi:hypothetical protein
MSALTHPPLDMPYISVLLTHPHDQDWIANITVLRGDFELSQMSPQRDYGPMVRRPSRHLDLALHDLSQEECASMKQKRGTLK